ncbi:MAG: glutaredoxin family protein [Burkholderiaceae bacterium]|nr:glutaredoxin family protein [Burkholderiaceae bacterium]
MLLTARPLASMALALACAGLAPAQAQTIYRHVGPDGRVTFSDQPQAGDSAKPVGSAAGVAGPSPALPAELRQVVSRYPVTLYTGPNCGPCNTGRTHLLRRGVPFTEKTVTSNEDIEALQRLSTDNSLPFMTNAGQHIRGYSDTEWTQYLDAAGYPGRSQLPSSFRNPPATPLVALTRPPATATPGDAGAAVQGADTGAPSSGGFGTRRSPVPAPSRNDNPAGIQF